MPEKRWKEPWLLLVASVVFAVVLLWPLLSGTGSPGDGGDSAGQTVAPPPAWLLPVDDAYISMRYAQQAVRGRFFEWNDGERASGATSPLHVLLLMPGAWLGGGMEGWSWWARAVGLLSVWLLGLAGARVLRMAGLPPPYPLAGGLALIWAGPMMVVSMGGLETALACAALLFTVSLWIEATVAGDEGGRRRLVVLAVAIAAMPWLRPDFGALTLVAAAATLLGLSPLPRRVALLLPLPGLALSLLLWLATGDPRPAGVISKSLFATPFLSASLALRLVGGVAARELLPVYLGARPMTLPPPVGLLAIAGCALVLASRSRRIRAVLHPIPEARALAVSAPLAVSWLVLFAVAPFSGRLSWQRMRHHHPGLVCAWLLAIIVVAVLVGMLVRRRPSWAGALRLVVLFLPLALALRFPAWAFEHWRETVIFHQRNGVTADWVAEHARGKTVLLHDAGLLALVHDGPAVDIMGLGTPEFALAYRHGEGAVVETLARRETPPEIAVVRTDLFPTGVLLGPPLLRPPLPWGLEPMLVAPFRADLLRRTRLEGSGIDFCYLPDEEAQSIHWQPPPWPTLASFAVTLPAEGGATATQGCRPLRGSIGIDLPVEVTSVRLRAVAQRGEAGRIEVRGRAHDARMAAALASLDLPAAGDRWIEATVRLPERGTALWLESAGKGVPCLESVAFEEGR